MKISSYYKTYFYSGLIIVLPLVLYAISFGIIQSTYAEAERLETEHSLVDDTQSFRTALLSALKNSEADRARLEAHFVRKDGIVDFINGLEGIGSEVGVEAAISSLGESWEPNGQAGALSLSLRVVGDFAKVYTYLRMLEQVPQKLAFDSIQLSASESGTPATIKQLGPHTVTWTAEIRATVTHYSK